MAVLGAAVARGWRLAEVRAAIYSGAWRGLAGLYERPSEPARLSRLLPAERRKAIAFAAGEKTYAEGLTSDSRTCPPAPTGAS